jgi:FKBP-type peptidyl-prolyl cis-trans isomerase
MKTVTITLTMFFCLSAACLAGAASQSQTNEPIPLPAAAQTPAGTNAFSDDKSRNSYAIGMMFGTRWKQQEIDVDYNWLLRGLKDGQAGGPTLMTEQEMGNTLNQFQKDLNAKLTKKRQKMAEKNKKDGEAFLAENKTKPGVVTMSDGLQYKIITNGTGAKPIMNDIVIVNYRGTLIDGKEFDSSAKAGHPIQFTVGKCILGWTEALIQMKAGSKWQLFIPSDLAYGERGGPGIQPNSVLIFDAELVSVEHPSSAAAPAPAAPLTSDIIKVPSQEEMKKGAKIEVIKPEDAAKLQQSQPQPSK